MLISKGTPLVLGLSILLLGLSGCAQTPTISQTDREAYLQQFIGQSSQYIDRNLDLKRLGYQQISEPELSSQQLSYVVRTSCDRSLTNCPVSGSRYRHSSGSSHCESCIRL